MKTILKLLAGLLTGIALGMLIAAVIIILFTDTTFPEFLVKLRSVDAVEIVLAATVGIAAFLMSLTILITAHEAGHLLCGLLSGYRFVSFRIFNLTFIKIDGKIRVKRFSLEGTGGQCLLSPPDLPLEKIPTAWYNAGGVLTNILLMAIALLLSGLNLNPFMREALVIFCLTAGVLIIMNGIPMKLGGIGNDAYNMLHLRNNLQSKRAMVVQLRSNALIQEGIRPKDMPAGWFEPESDIDYRNPLEVSIPLMHASRLVDEMEWERAYSEFEALYQHKADIMPLYFNEIACELAFCAMVTGHVERAKELLDAKVRKYLDAYRNIMSSKQRILCGIMLYIDNDRAKATEIYQTLEASKEKYLLQGEVKSDLAIMRRMLQI